MRKTLLTVYIRQHCHLCEQMVQALEPWRQGHGLGLELLDVDADPVLAARYGERVPVLTRGEQVICEFALDEDALVRALDLGAASSTLREASTYERIYAIARRIPPGSVATYGQIAAMEGRATPRMVGYAMAALPAGSDVPWQRVINARGEVSQRSGGGGTSRQRDRLEAEGVFFDASGRVDFARAGWSGPDPAWLARHGFFVAPGPAGRGRSAPATPPGRRRL